MTEQDKKDLKKLLMAHKTLLDAVAPSLTEATVLAKRKQLLRCIDIVDAIKAEE